MARRNSRVLCWSGGIDSLASYFMLGGKVDKLLYVKFGHRYQDREIAASEILADKLRIRNKLVVKSLSLSKEEKENSEIPSRNAFLILLGALEADEIVLSVEKGTESNESGDRSGIFFSRINEVLKVLYPDKDKKVVNPVGLITKQEEVELILSCKGGKELLERTFSCFVNGRGRCGRCSACIRTYLALEGAGVDTNGWFNKEPQYSLLMYEYVKRVRDGHYKGLRGEQYQKVMKKIGIW